MTSCWRHEYLGILDRFGTVRFISFLIECNTFIQQGCIKLIKRYSEDNYNVTNDFDFK